MRITNPSFPEPISSEDSELEVFVTVECAAKLKKWHIEKNCKKVLHGCITPCMIRGMANQPDINKTQLVVRLERSLKLQIEKEAAAKGLTTSALVNRILMEELDHITLTPDDYREIANQIEREQRKRNGKLPR